MREVRYKTVADFGAYSNSWENCSLEDFVVMLSSVSYQLAVKKKLPTIVEINQIFKKGSDIEGVSGGMLWKPFQIDQDEYSELCNSLLSMPLNEAA